MKVPAYPRTKPSGVEWLGDVPEHWKKQRIKHTTYVKGRIGWQGLRFEEFIDEGPYLVTGTDFVNGKINWKTCYHISPERYREDPYIQLKDDDLLITKDGTIGKVAVVSEMPGPASLNSGVFVTRTTRPVYITRYMYWLLNSAVFTGFIDSQKSGTTIAHLYQNVFVEFAYPTPPLEEQRAIAAFLDRETGRVDQLVAKKRELIERLKEKRTALISRTVTRGLPPAAARAAGLPENPPLKPSGLDWLGDIPKGWETKPLKFIALVKTGFAFSSDDFTDEGVPVLRIGDITRDGRIDFSGAKYLTADFLRTHRSVVVRQGDITMAMTGATIGKVGRYPFKTPALLNQRVCLFRPQQQNSIDFLWYLLNADFYIDHVLLTAFGGAQPNISDKQLLSCAVPVPPSEEQPAIAAYLDEETSKLDALVKKVETAVERLQEYRTALITTAVTGKIDVRQAVNSAVSTSTEVASNLAA